MKNIIIILLKSIKFIVYIYLNLKRNLKKKWNKEVHLIDAFNILYS